MCKENKNVLDFLKQDLEWNNTWIVIFHGLEADAAAGFPTNPFLCGSQII